MQISGAYKKFPSVTGIIDYLSRDIVENGVYEDCSEDQKFSIRKAIALSFRPLLQSKAISLFPVETLIHLTPDEQRALYDNNRHVDTWQNVPPLVVVAEAEHDIPAGDVIAGQHTVWMIDPTTEASLLKTLMDHGAVAIRKG
jgi:hypothetical protein